MFKRIQLFFKNKISAKSVYVFALVLFLLSLVPLVVISFYNFPVGDDFDYAIRTHNGLINGGFIGLLAGIFETIKFFYFNWQGTFSAIMIMSLQPAIFNVNLYFLSTIILLGTFILGTFSLCKTICTHYLKLNKYYYRIIAILICTISIQNIPSLVQGFYWWNGSIYYTFFFSLMLFQVSNLLKYFKYDKFKYFIVTLILTIIIAGGNFVLVSNEIIVMTLLTIYLFVKKNKSKTKILGLTLVLYILAMVSMLAPGNALRQAANEKMDLFTAVITSVETLTNDLGQWFNFYTIVYVIAILVILYKSYANIKFSFKHPFIVTILICGLLCALYTPPLYAMSYAGEGRLFNMVYYYSVWGILILGYYWIGHFRNKMIAFKNMEKTESIFIKTIYSSGFELLCLFLMANCMWFLADRGNISSYVTFHSLLSHEASNFKKEMQERYDIYNDESVEVVFIKPLSAKPKALYNNDLRQDPEWWANKSVSEYFNKKSVSLVGE